MKICRMYPYPSYGGAGPVAAGLQLYRVIPWSFGRIADPNPLREDQGGKGVKGA